MCIPRTGLQLSPEQDHFGHLLFASQSLRREHFPSFFELRRLETSGDREMRMFGLADGRDELRIAADLRHDTVAPVSYTHLDVYKRQTGVVARQP